MFFGEDFMFGDQVMVEDVEHEVFVPEELNFDLFFLGGRLNEGGGLFVDGDGRDFALALSSTNDEELLDITGDSDQVFDFVF